MLLLVCATITLATLSGVVGDTCLYVADGIYGHGCRSYTRCEGGAATVVDCTPDVLNWEKLPEPGCDRVETTPPPCGDVKDCSVLPDGGYPRLDDGCKSFFYCLGGQDMGTQHCNPGTVYNWLEQICNWPDAVYTPCGTKEPPTIKDRDM